ncbi:hypothetical protein [Methylomonas koyamae]|nr:hypothetical protein [Methylomonas koyamae]
MRKINVEIYVKTVEVDFRKSEKPKKFIWLYVYRFDVYKHGSSQVAGPVYCWPPKRPKEPVTRKPYVASTHCLLDSLNHITGCIVDVDGLLSGFEERCPPSKGFTKEGVQHIELYRLSGGVAEHLWTWKAGERALEILIADEVHDDVFKHFVGQVSMLVSNGDS